MALTNRAYIKGFEVIHFGPALRYKGVEYRHHPKGAGIVAESAKVADSAFIGMGSIIGPRVEIGPGVKILNSEIFPEKRAVIKITGDSELYNCRISKGVHRDVGRLDNVVIS